MKTSDLIARKENLSIINHGLVEQQINLIRSIIEQELSKFSFNEMVDVLTNLKSNLSVLERDLDEHYKQYQAAMQKLDQLIQKSVWSNGLAGEDYEESRIHCRHWTQVDDAEQHAQLYYTEAVTKEVLGRIRKYTSWRWPGLYLGCRRNQFTQEMVASDPLYLVDHREEYLSSAISQFTSEYQRRVRTYQILTPDLSDLPQNTFNFVLSWNYFNYLGSQRVCAYIKSVASLLRPGGIFLFSYNDADTVQGALAAESGIMGFTTKSELKAQVQQLGLEIVEDRSPEVGINWLEVRKPGQLTTIKAHQVLGEIRRFG
jgi:SAM-dependent methyltransferase